MLDENDPSWRLLKIHGYLAMIAFIVVLPVSAIVVTVGRRWDLWLICHLGSILVATVIAVPSITLAFIGSNKTGHLVTLHQQLGTALLVVIIAEMILGLHISLRWNVFRGVRATVLDIAHWWLGRIFILLSFAVCFQGFVSASWGLWAYIFTTACWFGWVIVYGILLIVTSEDS